MACVKFVASRNNIFKNDDLVSELSDKSYGNDINMQTNRPGTMERLCNDGKKILYERETHLNTKSMK